jgi:hypothetical protein
MCFLIWTSDLSAVRSKIFQPAYLPPERDDVRNIYHGKKEATRNVFRVAGANLIVYTGCQLPGKEPTLNRTHVSDGSLPMVHQDAL